MLAELIEFFRLGFEALKPGEWVGVLSMALATATSVFVYRSNRAANLKEGQLRSFESQVSAIDREIMSWGSRCIDAMSSAHILMATKASGRPVAEVAVARDAVLCALSALVDMGRLYFINRSPDLVGVNRPYANRGYRPAILDALMIAHEELRRLNVNDWTDAALAEKNVFGARRAFLSLLREEVDRLRDKRALERMRKKDDDWDAVAELVDNFEARAGFGSFWGDRPRPRKEVAADARSGRRPSPESAELPKAA